MKLTNDKAFTIDADNNVTILDAPPDSESTVAEGLPVMRTSKDLTAATLGWPGARLVEVWNKLAPRAGLGPIKKFENNQVALTRIWKAIEYLAAPAAGTASDPAPAAAAPPKKSKAAKPAKAIKAKAKKAAKPAKAAREPKAPREGTAKAKVIEMISRKGGATLDEIRKATGWQPHTVRGFMSTLPKKGGPEVVSSRRESDKARVYEAK
jgi:hypothetical protein